MKESNRSAPRNIADWAFSNAAVIRLGSARESAYATMGVNGYEKHYVTI